MKKQSNNNLTQVSNENVKKLTVVLKENLANGLAPVKKLTSADLWNIQCRSKTMLFRRHCA